MLLKAFIPLENHVGAVLEAISLGIVWFIFVALLQMKNIKQEWNNIKSN